MRTVRRLLYADIVSSVAFVAVAFLSLFFFIDFVDELADIGKSYTALHAAVYSLLELPGHLYELSPIAVLIGTIYAHDAASRNRRSSRCLRTGGLGPGRALWLLTGCWASCSRVITFVIGDYLSRRYTERATRSQLKAGYSAAA